MSRHGYALAELAAALVLAGLLGTILTTALLAQQRLTRRLSDRLTSAAAVRVTAAVLGSELRLLDREDLASLGRDSVNLRALRGIGIVCAFVGPTALVRYRGLREPDPAKDSLVVIGSAGPPRPLLTSAKASQGCLRSPGEDLFRWSFGGPVAAGTALLLFERGAYYLQSDLRYRRGAGGRQPLTTAVFDPQQTGFQVLASLPSSAGQPQPRAIRILLGRTPAAVGDDELAWAESELLVQLFNAQAAAPLPVTPAP